MNFVGAAHVCFTFSVLMSKISCLAVEITSFQPAIVPIRSITNIIVATSGQLNPNSTIQCRFNDMSTPAGLKGSMVSCDTPPMRQIDKAVLHLEVDGKLFKAKKQLRLHEPFKVTDISPKIASPSEQLATKISGITCEKWMTFFVRFQTANGTKRTQKGICNNSTVTCYIPEFPAHALLRVGVTLSNRIVQWSTTKLRIQYPVDSMKSSLKDLQPNIKRSGAFTFKVVLRDKFQNPVSDSGNSPLSVQYSPSAHPKEFHFLNCEASLTKDKVGSAYIVGCHGAKHERILIYPSINNVPVGGKTSYEVRTTLCPGKTSCDEKSSLIIIVFSSLGLALLLVFGVLVYKYRYKFHLKFVPSRGSNPDGTSIELDECQGNQPYSVEDLPESHANETAVSSDEEPCKRTENATLELDTLQNRLENGAEFEHSKEEEELEEKEEKEEKEKEEGGGGEEEEEKGFSKSSVENVPGAHLNVALSTENNEDNEEPKSGRENSIIIKHGPYPLSDTDQHHIAFSNPLALAMEQVDTENLELQEMKTKTTSKLELFEKL